MVAVDGMHLVRVCLPLLSLSACVSLIPASRSPGHAFSGGHVTQYRQKIKADKCAMEQGSCRIRLDLLRSYFCGLSVKPTSLGTSQEDAAGFGVLSLRGGKRQQHIDDGRPEDFRLPPSLRARSRRDRDESSDSSLGDVSEDSASLGTSLSSEVEGGRRDDQERERLRKEIEEQERQGAAEESDDFVPEKMSLPEV